MVERAVPKALIEEISTVGLGGVATIIYFVVFQDLLERLSEDLKMRSDLTAKPFPDSKNDSFSSTDVKVVTRNEAFPNMVFAYGIESLAGYKVLNQVS